MKLTLAIIVCIGLYTASADPAVKLSNELDEEYRDILQRAKKYALPSKTDSSYISLMLTWANSDFANGDFKSKCIEAFRKKCAQGTQTLHSSDSWKGQVAYNTLTERISKVFFRVDETSQPKRVKPDTDDGEDYICIICHLPVTLETKHYIVATKCGHIFGNSCLREWFLRPECLSSKKCPVCSQELSSFDITKLYKTKIEVFDKDDHIQVQKSLEALNKEMDTLKRFGIKYCQCINCKLSFKSEADLDTHRFQNHRSSSH